MTIDIITKEDLDEFRQQLLKEIKILFEKPRTEPHKWLKSYQVKNLLKISPNTLQKLKMDGTLKYTKIGGICYFKYEDIVLAMGGKSFH